MTPRPLLRLEGAVVAGVAVAAYFHFGHPWWLFVALVLAPDLTFVGYLGGTRVGAAFYNAAQSYGLPLVLLAYGVFQPSSASMAVALVWAVHIGVDRALAYGLKYPTAFKDTHMARV